MGILLLLAVGAWWFLSRQAPAAITPETLQALDNNVYVDLKTGETHTRQEIAGVSALTAGAAGAAGTAGAAGAGTFIGLSATAWTGIGAAVVAAIAVISALRTYGHLYANQIVKNYENPFGKQLAVIVDAKDAGFSNNTWTARDLQQAYDAVDGLWREYRAAMDVLIARGGDWAVVAKQSIRNLDSAEGMDGQFPEGYMHRILADIQTQIGAR